MAARGTKDSLKSKGARGAKAPARRVAAPAAESATRAAARTPSPNPMLDFGGILAIADALPVMIAYVDQTEHYLFVNRPIADWFERPRSQILGRTMREVMGEKNYAARKEAIAAAFKGQRQWFAAAFDHPTRGPLFTQAEYVPHVTRDGKVAGIIMVVQDVTEQRASELALRESEARFRRIPDSAPAPVWVSRLDRTRDFVNQAYIDFLGLDRESACTFDWREIIHPEDHDRIVAESIAGEASGEPFELVGRYRNGKGEYRWLRSVSQPRRDGDGRLVGFIGVASDITLAKQAELDLRRLVEERTGALIESEARFRAIFDAVMEVIVLLKPDGTVVEVNRTRAPWRAENARDVIGKPLWEAPTLKRYPGYEPLLREAVAAAAAGQTFTSELKFEAPGQPSAFLDTTMQPVRGLTGEIEYLLFEVRDITELKSAQEQLRQSQKMEALGQLTGGIAHDFNNLLTVVVGGLDIVAKRAEDEKLRRYATNALSAAERGARLTGQLLAFSRVQRLEVRPTPIAPLMVNMRPLLRNVLRPGIEKRFELDDDELPVMADPTQLEVAVLNLAINARDAMPEGGVLTFSTRRVAVKNDPELDDGDYVELSIADTGSGMSEEVAARAFEPFFTTKEVGKGTGLGLSMVYGMARQSGGSARIVSSPGAGTTVKLLFRVAQQTAVAADAREADSGRDLDEARDASVLVIDDDPDVRRFLVS